MIRAAGAGTPVARWHRKIVLTVLYILSTGRRKWGVGSRTEYTGGCAEQIEIGEENCVQETSLEIGISQFA